jgi:hypothetical protein
VRARALRAPVFLSSLPRKQGAARHPPPRPTQLRCFSFDPQKYIKSIELGPPTSKAFFFPLDHMQTEEAMKCEVTCPRPAHRSFADPSSNILGSKLCTGATIRPIFFGFSFFVFWSFLFVILCFSYLLFILFLFISSYSSLLSSSYSSCRYYSSSSFLLFLYFKLLLYYRHDTSVILMSFSRWPSLFDPFWVKVNVSVRPYVLTFFALSFFLFFDLFFLLLSSYSSLHFSLIILLFLYLNCLLYCRHAY